MTDGELPPESEGVPTESEAPAPAHKFFVKVDGSTDVRALAVRLMADLKSRS